MEENRPGYYAIIPADVRYDDTLAPNAKLFYAEITALAEKEGYCYAGNEYFMQVYGFSDRTVTRLISQLEQCGYIIRQIIKDNEGKVSQRRLHLRASTPHGLTPDKIGGTRQNCQYPPDKIGGENNTSDSNKKESKKKKPDHPDAVPKTSLTDEQIRETFTAWIVEIAPESWDRNLKVDLLNTLCRFYGPRSEKKRNPERSINGLTSLKRNLLKYSEGYPEKMIQILDRAIEAGWRGIRPLDERQFHQPQQPDTEEGVRWL